MKADLRCGPQEKVLADSGEVDAVITDAPFSARVHNGATAGRNDGSESLVIPYDPWTWEDVYDFVFDWSYRTRGWMVCLTSHDLCEAFEEAYEAAGRVKFAPVPCVIPGMTVRQHGDGPSSWTVYAMVARPKGKEFYDWGTLPGEYRGPPNRSRDKRTKGHKGGKPLWLMQALVRDYSRVGDRVCDPYGGLFTTVVAALSMHRRAIAAEIDRKTFNEGKRRVNRPIQPAIVETIASPVLEQGDMFPKEKR